MFQKFKELRHNIGQRHQQEVDELRQKNHTYKEKKKSMKRVKKQLVIDYNKLCDEYEELEQKAHELEQDANVLKEEIKGKDTALQDFQDTLTAKEEELKKSELEKKNLLTNYESIKEELISKLNLSECSYLNLLYKITTGAATQIGPETRLRLKLNNPKDMKFLTFLNKRMPAIDVLSLREIPPSCQEVKTFLAAHFPNKVRKFSLNYASSMRRSLAFYLEELVEVSKRVTEQLFICNFEVSQDQLVSLFSANRHKQRFGFIYCKLSLSSVPDFGGTLAGSTMQALDLSFCGGSSYGDWENNESHFENLIAGLSKEEDFRKNLKGIGIDWCRMKKNVVEKVLADYCFEQVEIW